MLLVVTALTVLTASPNALSSAKTAVDARIVNGDIAFEGDDWLAPEAVQIAADQTPTWDLGDVKPLSGAALQADHNDTYILSVSEDGEQWTDVWRAGPIAAGGLRTRSGTFDAKARFVRIRGTGGDGRFSISELEVFQTREAMREGALLKVRLFPSHPFDRSWAWLSLATLLSLLLVHERSPKVLFVLVSIPLAAFAAYVIWGTFTAPTLEHERVNWIRAATAFSALAAVLRAVAFRVRWPARKALVIGVLAVSAFVAVLCFANFARPQFWDSGHGSSTFLHHYDMRTYFPIAKYFPELRFDGVYAASAAVVAEERGFAAIAGNQLRNLRTHDLQTIQSAEEEIKAVRARFSDERWKSFVKDMNYFRRAMNDGGFLGSMHDHGGNATPVWFLAARLLFAFTPASDASLWAGVVLDILLMLTAFAALYWAYGPRTALLAMVVFGAMDFYMFGSNWFGATLRHDWLALWCIGVALLKKERFFLAGGALAWAGLIRAFPALTFAALTMPVLWAFGVTLWKERRGFSFKRFITAHRDFVRVCFGAAVIGGALLALSTLVFGVSAWVEWFHKVALLNAQGHVNNISLSSSSLFKPGATKVIGLAFTALTLFAVRKSPLDEAAAFGTALVGVVFSPANYYMHCLFILVVLGRENEERGFGAFAWVVLLGMCIGCYWTNLTGDLNTHFRRETWIMLAAVLALVLWRLVESFTRKPAAVAAPAVEPKAEPIAA